MDAVEKECPVCKARMDQKEVFRDKLNTSNVVDDYQFMKRSDFVFYQCPVCGHGVIQDVLDQGFYTDFSVALVGADDKAASNYRAAKYRPFVQKLAELAVDTDRIVEIGSGCGYLLKAAKEKFTQVLGVEPSGRECAVSRDIAPDCEIINDYFSPSLCLEKNVSAFAATMVFEHLPNIKEAMSYSFEFLKNGGGGTDTGSKWAKDDKPGRLL